MSNQISHFGIMGGLYNRKISGRSSMNRVTSRLEIPAGAASGLRYMKMHNLLSRNPLGSGGVGRVVKNKPCNCNVLSTISSSIIHEDNSDWASDNPCTGISGGYLYGEEYHGGRGAHNGNGWATDDTNSYHCPSSNCTDLDIWCSAPLSGKSTKANYTFNQWGVDYGKWNVPDELHPQQIKCSVSGFSQSDMVQYLSNYNKHGICYWPSVWDGKI